MVFEKIYHDYSPQIFRLCKAYVNDSDAAQDLAQETFIAVWKNLDKFKEKSSIGTWIYRIAVNKCLKEISKEKRKQSIKLDQRFAVVEDLEAKNEKLKILHQYIAELKEVDRLIISMLLEGLSNEEIAEVMDMSHGNVRTRIHRIKEKLSSKIKSNGRV